MTRTQMGLVELCEKTGKYKVSFDMYRGTPGQEYLATTATSAPVFETEDDAYAGGARALEYLAETDRFPNLCEKF